MNDSIKSSKEESFSIDKNNIDVVLWQSKLEHKSKIIIPEKKSPAADFYKAMSIFNAGPKEESNFY